MNELLHYFYTKLIQYIVFENEALKDVSKGNFDSWLSQEDFFTVLKDYCDYMADNNYLEKPYKENLLDLINYVRFLQHKMQASAEMIAKVNSCTGTNCTEFYTLALDSHNLEQQDHYKYKEILAFKEEMSAIFSFDFAVLASHTVFPEEDYSQVFEICVNNPDYFRVIFNFASECPIVFQSKIFLQRFANVLLMNDFLFEQSDKKDKALLLKPINDKFLDAISD